MSHPGLKNIPLKIFTKICGLGGIVSENKDKWILPDHLSQAQLNLKLPKGIDHFFQSGMYSIILVN